MDKVIQEWCDQVNEFHLPRWEELPDIDLYRDQVITYIERYLKLISMDEKIITSSMINNYVKWKMMPAPNKKKQYDREHLGYLIVISILKQVVNIQLIKEGIELIAKQNGTHNAYNLFCSQLEESIKYVLSLCFERYRCEEPRKMIESDEVVLHMGTLAFASKLIAVKRLTLDEKGEKYV
ncbi:MAG: DUF1836 domain-containing protein [Erysipelotrichaceae bacterium]|nr:DUF1836 domain-containing protein [Erysipelotrichaceae bacterium]MDY5251661.1 DUF1836 domain-containing protein [Erysipelotrichaceae bacterium]